MKEPVLILGATSSIARATANAFAEKGYPLFLAGRDVGELKRIASDITIRYQIDVKYGEFDALDYDCHDAFLLKVVREMHGLGGVLLAFGESGSQPHSIQNFKAAEKVIQCNYLGACSILTHCANYFDKLGKGFIIGLTSISGERGSQSNYVYGSAKGALTLFLQGLRNRLHREGVRVMTVKLGFIDTAMTFGQKGMFFLSSPEKVAKSILKSLNGSSDIIYVPWFWRPIMTAVKWIPEFIFKRLPL